MVVAEDIVRVEVEVEVEKKEEEEDLLIVDQDLNQRKIETAEEDTKREEMKAHLAVQDLLLNLKREEEMIRIKDPENDLKALEKTLKTTERTLRIRRIRRTQSQSPSQNPSPDPVLSPSPAQNLHPNLDLKARHQIQNK